MATVTDGTIIRLRYQVELWYPYEGIHIAADAGREFVCLDGPDVTEQGWGLSVVEPDEYGEDGLEIEQFFMVIDDPDCFETIGVWEP